MDLTTSLANTLPGVLIIAGLDLLASVGIHLPNPFGP